MTDPVSLTPIQFGNTYDGEKTRRLADDLARTQRQLNSLIDEVSELRAQVAALEA